MREEELPTRGGAAAFSSTDEINPEEGARKLASEVVRGRGISEGLTLAHWEAEGRLEGGWNALVLSGMECARTGFKWVLSPLLLCKV